MFSRMERVENDPGSSLGASPPASAPPIFDVGDEDFERRVLERSRQVPVVVDFWAAWCAPCRALGPVLEKEVAALGGRVELAKVDTDRAQRVAQAFGVRSIPQVMAFRGGEVVDEFVGAQPASVVRAFLARLAPSEAQQLLEEAKAAATRGDGAAAEQAGGRLLAEPGVDPQIVSQAALLMAASRLALGRADEAAPYLDRVDERGPLADRADALRQLIAFVAEGAAWGDEERARAALAASERDHEARYALAAHLAGRGRYQESLDQLLELVSRSRKFKDDGARRAMLLLFDHLGADSELSREFRRRLQILT